RIAPFIAVTLVIAAISRGQAPGFASTTAKAEPAAVTGLYNWIHSTADADRGWDFYRSVLNMQMANSPFGPAIANGVVAQPRPRAEGSRDPLVWDLTNTHGSQFRNVFMRIPGVDFGHELAEFTGIDGRAQRAHLWDPGATMLILNVPDLDLTVDRLKKAGGEIVSLGGQPVKLGATRAVIARDPDGFLLELIESPSAGAAIGVTVADLAATRRFYEDLLGFKIQSPAGFEDKAIKFIGLTRGEYRVSTALVPGTSIRIEFYEFRKLPVSIQPVRYHFQDPGAPQFQFRVRDLDSLIEEAKTRGVPFVSIGQKPIQRAFGRFVFVSDPDGVFVEFVHPSK